MVYTWIHMGNCPKFEITPRPEKIKHYSSMVGTKALDDVAFKSKEFELDLVLEELTPNLIDAVMLSTSTGTTAGSLHNIGAAANFIRAVRMTGNNDVGAQVEVILPKVFFSVDKALSLISDDWFTGELTGDILANAGSWGTVQIIGNQPTASPGTGNYHIGKGNVYFSV
jgi:hypothetical protein